MISSVVHTAERAVIAKNVLLHFLGQAISQPLLPPVLSTPFAADRAPSLRAFKRRAGQKAPMRLHFPAARQIEQNACCTESH
jgi:hypothetical protein